MPMKASLKFPLPRRINAAHLPVLVLALGLPAAQAAVIMEWNASDWSGSGAWTDTVAGEQLTTGAGTITQAVDNTSFSGSNQAITSTVYDGSSGFVSDATSLMGGLQEFTISAVIRVGATPGANAGPLGSGWQYNVISGFELGGGNQGEFQFGFHSGNTLNGAVGLNGDQFIQGGSVPANQWATVAFVLNQDPNNTGTLTEYSIITYINGVSQGTSGVITYGGETGAAIRDSPFGVGYNVIGGGDRRYFTGEIAHLRYDNTALDQATLTANAANYLGTLEPVPEPTAGLLALLGVSVAAARRRRA